jgi:endonuclease/exonuclease/phosphatase family metal-dependent hydrolase
MQPVGNITFSNNNPRTSQPNDVGSSFKIASFNVLNYFNGDGLGGGFPTSRGADSAFEFNRQRDKVIAAINAIDAAVVGLMEIENDGYGPESAVQDLVNGLNSAGQNYAFIDPGVSVIGTDEIAVALIYQPDKVTPVGNAAILDSSVNPLFDDTKNRPALAQTFIDNATGAQFTVVVNHLKSKGSDCNDVGDPDTGDGQGNCNVTRTQAAQALAAWLAGDPTGAGDSDILIIGDLNSYAMEDPITALKNAGYTNLVEQYQGDQAYSYTFFGESGYLDHALASASLASQVTGVTEWHINTDEPVALDYNEEFKTPNQVMTYYNPDPYRASDHDPVVIGLDLTAEAVEVAIDIWPLLPINPINLNSGAKVPAAILSSPAFDATTVNAQTVELAGAPATGLIFSNWPTISLVDINWDGRRDMILYFSTQDMTLVAGDTTATLTGETFGGLSFSGTDSVLVIPPLAPFLISPDDGAVLRTHRPIFRWRSLGVTCYAIQIASDPDFNNLVQEATVVQLPFYRASYLPNGTYYWRVQIGGECNITEGPWGGPRSFVIDGR